MYNSPYRGVIHCVTSVYRKEGIRAFYRSYATQLTMNVPFQSIHFTAYEHIQNVTNKDRVYNPPAHMLSGGVAGAIAAAATTPLDVCKTVLNTQETGVKAKGFLDAVHHIIRLSGPMGFFKGLQARVLYQMPAAAICWSTYETFKYLLIGKSDAAMLKSAEKVIKVENKDKVINLRLVLPQASVKAEDQSVSEHSSGPPPPSPGGFKSMELPAVSGTNLYGTLSLNTMHHGGCEVPTMMTTQDT